MATRDEIVKKVRRAVADFKEPVKYEKEYYGDAIDFALQKLSFDLALDTPYTTVPLVPFQHEFLLLKLATIQMCYVRAGERTDSGEGSSSNSDGAGDDFSSITVPDLSITKKSVSSDEQAERWIDLAVKLQEEYDGEIEHIGGESLAAEVQVGHLKKVSLATGGFIKRVLDEGPPARTLNSTVNGASVLLQWNVWYHETFNSYRLYRATDSGFSDSVQLRAFSDNHDEEYTDSGLDPGTYFYKIVTVNRNDLKTDSNVQEVTIV